MTRSNQTLFGRSVFFVVSVIVPAVLALALVFRAAPARASDHGDAPTLTHDQGCDIGDSYFFLDPNDNSRVVIVGTVRGFIVPGEAANFGIFDPAVRYRFEIENTGDASPDGFIDVTFGPRANPATAQTATVRLLDGQTFTALATNPTAAPTANPPVITTDPASSVRFFAGETDDPFFFDIPAFQRFVASARAGAPDPTLLNRGRDSFAGYNINTIVLSIPAGQLRGTAGNDDVGLNFLCQRRTQTPTREGVFRSRGRFLTVDRSGNPGVNVVLIPFAQKNAFNAATTVEDAAGRFVPGILSTLDVFGTDATSRGILASVAVARGDILRLDLSIANSGPGGGNNAGAGFPNGRRLRDDIVDTVFTVINNRSPLGDSVDANDVPLRNRFPFVAAPQQPRDPGVIDDNTRN